MTPAPLPRPQQCAEIEGVQLDLMSCSEVRYEEVDDVHGVLYVHEDLDERGWTPMVKKRRCHSIQSPRQSPLKVNSSEALSTEGSSGEDCLSRPAPW